VKVVYERMAELREPLSEEESKTTTNLVRGGRLVELPGAYDPEKPDYLLLSHTAPIKMLPPKMHSTRLGRSCPTLPPALLPHPLSSFLSLGILLNPKTLAETEAAHKAKGGRLLQAILAQEAIKKEAADRAKAARVSSLYRARQEELKKK